MLEFHSLSPQPFEENLPENFSVFSHYFFKTKEENPQHF